MTTSPSRTPHPLPPPRAYVAGAWSTSPAVADAWLCDASTGARLVAQVHSDEAVVEAALAAAADLDRNGWAPPSDRAAALDATAAAIERRLDELAWIDAITTGILFDQARVLAQVAARCFRVAAELAVTRADARALPAVGATCEIERLPRGPAAVIAPWNASTAIAAHKLASALAAGCPVILKPSEHAPLSAQVLVECAAPHLPAGALALVHGDGRVGARLVGDPRTAVVSFTGGLVGGRAVALACAPAMKPAQLELGGSNPFVVLDGADVEAAAVALVAGLTTLNGQWCRAVGRVIVARPIAAALFAAVLERLAGLRLGAAIDPASEMGPLAHATHRDTVTRAIARLVGAGGEAHAPTRRPALDGYFVAPTLITGVAPARARDEIFGPVATWHEVADAAEATRCAADSPYGLAAYVFGPEPDAARVGRALRCGMVNVNRLSLTSAHPLAVRPAWGLSGLGDEGVVETFEHFRGARVTTVGAGRP